MSGMDGSAHLAAAPSLACQEESHVGSSACTTSPGGALHSTPCLGNTFPPPPSPPGIPLWDAEGQDLSLTSAPPSELQQTTSSCKLFFTLGICLQDLMQIWHPLIGCGSTPNLTCLHLRMLLFTHNRATVQLVCTSMAICT